MSTRRTFISILPSIAAMGAAPARTAAGTKEAMSPTPLLSAWTGFKEAFLDPLTGRVRDTGNKGISHSEGQGVALLAAALLSDKAAFQKVWEFTKSMQRADGLFSWSWSEKQGITDRNNASDGDLYIAWALAEAGRRWGAASLTRASAHVASALRSQAFITHAKRLTLLPGAAGFSAADIRLSAPAFNPSYLVLPAFRALERLSGDGFWLRAHADSLAWLDTLRFGQQGLPLDWVVLTDPPTPWKDRPVRFGYEAIRIPLFLAWDSQTQARTLTAVANLHSDLASPAWVNPLTQEKAPYPAPPGFRAVAALARQVAFSLPESTVAIDFAGAPPKDADYYSASLTLLSLLAAKFKA